MIMGSIREGNLLHIEDLYSRDMSSPLRDSLLDGEESLSAAYGLQTGNRTLLMFRRLISGFLGVIWKSQNIFYRNRTDRSSTWSGKNIFAIRKRGVENWP